MPSKRTALNRADLIDCLYAHGSEALDAWAATLGYRRREAPSKTPRPAPPRREAAPTPDATTSPDIAPAAAPRARYYRVVESRQLSAEEAVQEAPPWFTAAHSYRDETDLLADPNLQPPAQPPLMRWSRLWPFLKLALGGELETRALDVPRIVALLARGAIVERLPRRRRAAWAQRAQVWLDYAEALQPFWPDLNEAHERLRRRRGLQGLTLVALPDGDPFGRRWLYHGRRGWQPLRDEINMVPGAPVLMLSDLGCLDDDDARRRQWLRLGQRLRRYGVRPVALMPCPARWWDVDLASRFYPVAWDRAARPPRRLGVPPARPAAPASEAVEQLLSLLAPAIRVEPALLRAVRYLLPPSEADVGSEAEAWRHPSVRSEPQGFYFDPPAVEAYRQAFRRQDRELRRRAAWLIEAHHAHLSPVIAMEEQLLLAELNRDLPAKVEAPVVMRNLVKTLHAGEGDFAGSAMAWAHRMLSRQHSGMWGRDELAAAWVLANRAQLSRDEPLTPPEGLDLARVSWLLPEAKRYTLRQRGAMLCLEAEHRAPSEAGLDMPGSPLAAVTARTSFAHLFSEDRALPLTPAPARAWTLPQPWPEGLRLWTGQQELRIESIPRPDWAQTIGCDSDGLFVAWQEGQRRAYWVPPGLYPVAGRNGARLGQLPVIQGYWRDAAEALEQLREGFVQPDWAEDFGLDAYGLYAVFAIDGIEQRMRWVAPGEFVMGSPETEPERLHEEIQHDVILSWGLWLADTACTQAMWQAVMGENPSYFKGARRPVEQVNWDDAQAFIARLNNIVPGGGFRLPTEAEWEYACRAGTTTPFWFGDQITPEQVNYDGNYPYASGAQGLYRQRTVDVQSLPGNDWGLFEMHGNVWEWCADWYGVYPSGAVINPVGPATGVLRVLRGGCWAYVGGNARSTRRHAFRPGYRIHGIGFRVARGQAGQVVSQQAPEAPIAGRVSEPGQTQRSGVGQGLLGRLQRWMQR